MRGVLVDAGPLVALVNRGDTRHRRCVDALKAIRDPMLTVWPAVTEARILVRDSWPAQAALVPAAERERLRHAFTLDQRDFRVYRPAGLGRVGLIPS